MALQLLPAHVMPGERARTEVIHFGNGYFYHKHNDRNGAPFISLRCIHWRNQRIKCRGRGVMSRDRQYFALSRNHSGHLPEVLRVTENDLRRRILDRVRTGDAAPFAEIVRQEGVNGRFPVAVRANLPVSRLRTPMRNARLEHLPRVPRNLPVLGAFLSEAQFQRVTETLDGQDNIFAGACGVFPRGTVSVVFISRRMMGVLQTERKFYCDGTFRKRPKKPNSAQIFSISITWEHQATNTKHVITVLRAFMQKRTEEAYTVLFDFLCHIMPNLDPDILHCDNEQGLVNALTIKFPGSRIVTCLWHYDVDVFQYARGLGLHVAMETSWVMDAIVRSLCAIPLLPTQLLYEGLVEVGNWARRAGFMHYPQVRTLFSYMDREWMRRRRTLSVFGSADRTNNVSESSNAALNWFIRQDRPSVYDLIRAFVCQEDQFMVDVHALSNGRDASRAQRLSCLYNDDRIRNLSDDLTNNRISVLHFLRSASRTLQAPYDHVFGR